MIKSSEEIRAGLDLNQSQFSKFLNLSRRSYNARLMQEQDWKLQELIKLSELNKGKVSVTSGQNTYEITIKLKK